MTKLARRLASPDLVCPDHYSGPDWVLTDGPAVAELCARAGFAPDPQQELGLDIIFAVGENGLPACFAFGCIVCRQNLKTGLLKQAALGWLFVTEERRIVWSAHEMDTTREAQKELAELISDCPSLAKYLAKNQNNGIYDANGQMRIELDDGRLIKFKARTLSGGRGLSGDKVILDEAFALKASHVGSLIPTMTARPHGQVLYASSAGKADSAILRDVRDRGRAGSSPRLGYIEWLAPREDCADKDCTHPKDAVAQGIDCALDREHLAVKANPTLTTGRISLQTIKDMRQELPPEEFTRECLGWWDEEEKAEIPPAIDLDLWLKREKKKAGKPAEVTIVLDVSPDRRSASIGVAGAGPNGRTLVMVHRAGGTAWVVPKLVNLLKKRKVVEVALHPGSQAAVLIPALQAADIEFESLTTQQNAAACAAFQEAVLADTVAHLGQAELDEAVSNARTRYSGEGELWDRKNRDIDISPLVACSAAAYRWGTRKPARTPMATFI